MSAVISTLTPQQQIDMLLNAVEAAESALNQIPNRKLNGEHKDTYAVAALLGKVQRAIPRLAPAPESAASAQDAAFLEDMIRRAQVEADQGNAKLVVVHDPIGNAEDIENGRGPYGYCPAGAKDLLFRHGTIVAIIRPGVAPERVSRPSPAAPAPGADKWSAAVVGSGDYSCTLSTDAYCEVSAPVVTARADSPEGVAKLAREYIEKYLLNSSDWGRCAVHDKGGNTVAEISYNGSLWMPGGKSAPYRVKYAPTPMPPVPQPKAPSSKAKK